MSDPFVAEIRMFAGNFAPRSWAFCTGQLLPIAQNTALFSLIGTTYGGDGRTTTALPDLKGRAPMHPGRGPGLTVRRLGEKGGAEVHTLTELEIANHSHGVSRTDDLLNTTDAANSLPGTSGGRGGGTAIYHDTSGQTLAPGGDTRATGGSQPHTNVQPFQALNFIIALQGTYPSRS